MVVSTPYKQRWKSLDGKTCQAKQKNFTKFSGRLGSQRPNVISYNLRYDYYLREAWLDNAYSHETLLYPDGETYDPDYLHSH